MRYEDSHAADSAYYAVDDKVLQCPLGNYSRCNFAHPSEKAFYPLLRVGSEHEYRAEHHPHDKQKEGETEPSVRNKAVYAAGLLLCVFVTRLKCLLQCSIDKTVLRTADGSLCIYAHLCLYSLCGILCHSFPTLHLHAVAELAGNLLVTFEQFECPIAYRELRRQVIGFVELFRQWGKLSLDDAAVVDVDVAYGAVLALEELDDGVEEFVEPLAVLGNGGYHGYSHHGPQVLVVNLGSACEELVVHVERNHGTQVHVNKFRSEVEVALEVRCHD